MEVYVVSDDCRMKTEIFFDKQDARNFLAMLLSKYRRGGFVVRKFATWYEIAGGYEGGKIWMQTAIIGGGAE